MLELTALSKRAGKSATPRGERQSLLVARLLRARAQEAGNPDLRFGHESQLAGEYGVARATLRAAMRELERQGVIRTARGRNGGLYRAVAPKAEAARRLSDYLTIEDAPISSVAEQAMRLYRIAARWAAERHGQHNPQARSALARARQLLQASQNLDAWCEMRAALVAASGNCALEFLYGGYQAAYRDALAAELHLGNLEAERTRELWSAEARLIDAVATGNPKTADAVALACINLESKYITISLADGMLARTLMPQTLFQLSSMAPKTGDKLAHQTMRALHAHIRQSAATVGARLGSVVTLAAEYGVSVDVMRDALLLAQRQQLVVLRRGRGGGVFVSAPDLDRAVNDAACHLIATVDRMQINAVLIKTIKHRKNTIEKDNLTVKILKTALGNLNIGQDQYSKK
jgi:DNA-binding FadR family transcriptional regulator